MQPMGTTTRWTIWLRGPSACLPQRCPRACLHFVATSCLLAMTAPVDRVRRRAAHLVLEVGLEQRHDVGAAEWAGRLQPVLGHVRRDVAHAVGAELVPAARDCVNAVFHAHATLFQLRTRLPRLRARPAPKPLVPTLAKIQIHLQLLQRG